MQQSTHWFCRQLASLGFMQLNSLTLQNSVATSELPIEGNFWSEITLKLCLGIFWDRESYACTKIMLGPIQTV